MAILSPSPKQQFFATDGSPLAAGKVYTYAAGTTTPITTYVNSGGVSANTNPIILDSRGEANIWLTPGTAYKYKVATAADVEIYTVDNIAATDASGSTNLLSNVAGSPNAITATSAYVSSYVAGQVFRFIPVSNNTGPATININSLGVKNIYRNNNTTLVANDLRVGNMIEIVYDGTQFKQMGLPGSVLVTEAGIVTANQYSSTAGFDGPSIRFKNRIINGGMRFNQRNGSAAQNIVAAAAPGSALAYTLDRFYASATTSAASTVTVARVTGPDEIQSVMEITGAANVTGIVVGTRIESSDVYDLIPSVASTYTTNGEVVLSLMLANTLLTSVSWAVYRATATDSFGTIAVPTRALIASGTFTGVSSVLTPFNTPVITLSNAAKTGLEIVLSVGAQVSGTWQIANVQLEQGRLPSKFENPPTTLELARCQRYFCKTFDPDVKPANNTGATGEIGAYTQAVNTTFGYGWRFPVTMRAVPATFAFYNPAAANNQWSSAGVTATVVNEGMSGVTLAAAGPTIGAGARSGIHATASAEL